MKYNIFFSYFKIIVINYSCSWSTRTNIDKQTNYVKKNMYKKKKSLSSFVKTKYINIYKKLILQINWINFQMEKHTSQSFFASKTLPNHHEIDSLINKLSNNLIF